MHLEILGFPMGGAYYYRDIFAQFKLCGKSRTYQVLSVSKRKLGETRHFSEIIKLQFGKMPYIALYFTAFRVIVAYISLKNAWLPPIFFLDSKSPC